MTEREQRSAAKHFADTWKGKGYEKGESQPFWLSLLRDVYGIEHPESYISFENQVHLDHTSFIDGYIPTTKVLIEQKSIDKDLRKAIKQSDGLYLTPFEQAKRYIVELPKSKHPDWVITCNFGEFNVYDMENPKGEPEIIKLADLEKEYYRLQFLVDSSNTIISKEIDVSFKAGDVVGQLYDAFLSRYKDPTNEDSLKSLNKLCVRLVFCLYAEDAGIFGKHLMFHDYMAGFKTKDMRKALIDLFHVLDQKSEMRDVYLDDELAAFPYVNGGLFADEDIEVPQFTDEIRELLLNKASEDFDWSEISPTIFGAVFESTLNPETRRSGGMHYTSIENIHKVIDPLFLDNLRREFDDIRRETVKKTRERKLKAYQDKLASLKFLDPAAGSGNFLTETYLSLRRLENETLKVLLDGQPLLDNSDPIKVSISQFFGIEINDFAVAVAKTALWIAESQMLKETENIVRIDMDFLPLKTNVNIVEGNALGIDWNEVVPKTELTYIMGNPPFVGARFMSKDQKADLNAIFPKWKNAGNLDYVTCWYKKASDLMRGTNIRAALVSTNSVCQGESVANLWKPLFESGVHIDFAYRTFRWDSEANLKAHVHCIIVGFSTSLNHQPKRIFDGERFQIVNHINGYLVDADDFYIENRRKPLCPVPEIGMGNQPIDDGKYLFFENEMIDFIGKEPLSAQYFHPWYGSKEFINRKPRYCLWLGECSPAELRKMPECMKRIQAVKESRKRSDRLSTRKLAESPTRFQTENMPKGTYIVIPEVSSEKRRYVPMGYMDETVMCSNKLRLMPDSNLYHFGVLESNVHMAWMRAVAGRLEMRYDYSIKIVYNNFPWPEPTEEQKMIIKKTAQEILDARAKYPDSSLADLYDPDVMPPELRTAHQHNDKAVMTAYGIKKTDEAYNSESACVAFLMRLYQKKVIEFNNS